MTSNLNYYEPSKNPYLASERSAAPDSPYHVGESVFVNQPGDRWFLGEPCGAHSGPPLRAVHIGPCFSNGGAEQQIIDLLKFLNPQHIRLEKLIVTDPKLVDPAMRRRVHVPVEVGDVAAVQRASREFDIVLFWGVALDDWLADCPPQLGVFIAHGDGQWTQKFLDGSLLVTDHVIAVSQGVQDKVCHGAPSSVILNGVDAARLAQSRSRSDVRTALGFAEDDFVLGYVGRFSSEKRAHLTIETLRHLPPEYKGLFVGWGPLRGELMEMANDLIPGRYAFVSANEYLGDFYHAMDAFSLLSAHEGFALVMIEAMMCGCPVVATPVGAVPEVICDGRNGLVVKAKPRKIARVIAQLRDVPKWARGLADSGQAYAQQHGHARRMARDYEALLARLWKKKCRAVR